MLVAQYIISVLVTWVVIVGGILVHKYIPLADLQVGEALAAEAEREIAAKQGIAYDAVRLAEDVYAELKGPDKLQKAVEWAAAKLSKLGITVTPDEIEELIRIAYQDFAGKVDAAPVSAAK